MGAQRTVRADWETALGLRREAQFFDGHEAAFIRKAALKYASKCVITGGAVQGAARSVETMNGVQAVSVG